MTWEFALQMSNKRKGIRDTSFIKTVQLLTTRTRTDNTINGLALTHVEVSAKHNAFTGFGMKQTSGMLLSIELVEDSGRFKVDELTFEIRLNQ